MVTKTPKRYIIKLKISFHIYVDIIILFSIQGTIRRGTRCSTAKAFLRPARLRPNLHVAMQAHVTKIIINPVTKRVTGVQMLRDGRVHLVHAKREVILSAGSIGSPQLLMLSGIGPGEHLQRLGIPVLQDLRVGDNLQDHVGMFGLTFIVDKPVAIVQNRLRVRSKLLYSHVFYELLLL